MANSEGTTPGPTGEPTAADRHQPWDKGVAPAYIGLFLLIVFYDQLAAPTLAVGGLLPSVIGLAVGGMLAFGLLYYVPATWGLQARLPLEGVAARTFGASGARWVPGVLMGLAQVVWFAVTIAFGTDLTLRAMVTAGFLDETALSARDLGGFAVKGPLYLVVSLVWVLASALIGTVAVRLAAAVMGTYPIFPALILGVTMLWALPGVGRFSPPGFDPETGRTVVDGSRAAFLTAVQLVLGFSATAGAAGAEWGASSRDRRDVTLGGIVGLALTPVIVGSLALVIVAGAIGRSGGTAGNHPAFRDPASPPTRLPIAARSPEAYRFHDVYETALGGPVGGVGLMVLNLALLGPACYAPSIFSQRFHEIGPTIPKWGWALIGSLAAWPFLVIGAVDRLPTVFGLLGAVMAPVVGAMAADAVRDRGRWTGPRPGFRLSGLLAWSMGVPVGLLPLVGALCGLPVLERFEPATLLAFVVAFLVGLLAGLVGDRMSRSVAARMD